MSKTVSDGEIAWRELERCMQEWKNVNHLYVKCGDTVVGAYRHLVHASNGNPMFSEWTWTGYLVGEGIDEDIKSGRLVKIAEKEIEGRKVEYYTERKPSLCERLREHWVDVVVGIIGLAFIFIVGYLCTLNPLNPEVSMAGDFLWTIFILIILRYIYR